MTSDQKVSFEKLDRITDSLERLEVVNLYLNTDLDHHAIARKLGIGTQRATGILKGFKKLKTKKDGK